MVKIKPVKFFGTIGLVGLASLIILSFTTTDSEFGFNLPPPQLSIVQVGDEQIQILEGADIPSIGCWVNMAVNILDEKGSIIATEKSGFLKVQPTLGVVLFDLTDVNTGQELVGRGGFELVPQMKCSTVDIQIDALGNIMFLDNEIDPNVAEDQIFPVRIGALSYPSFEQPITVESNDLVMKVFSQEKDSNFLKETFNGILTIDKRDIKTGESIVLGKATIPADRILAFLEDGKYRSTQIIVLEGAIPLHWTESATCFGACVNLPLIINLETEQNFENGKRVSVSNPISVNRDLDIDKNVSGNTTPDDSDNPDEPISCASGQIRQGTVCVTISNVAPIDPNNPLAGIQIPIIGDIVTDLRICLDSGNPDCYFTEQFIGIYFVAIGGILILGAIIALATKQKDYYGVDISG